MVHHGDSEEIMSKLGMVLVFISFLNAATKCTTFDKNELTPFLVCFHSVVHPVMKAWYRGMSLICPCNQKEKMSSMLAFY